MRKKTILLLLLILGINFLNELYAQIPENDKNWELVIDEEFNNISVFNSRWQKSYWGWNTNIGEGPNCTAELQVYKPDNVNISTGSGGLLTLTAKKETFWSKVFDWEENGTILCDGIANYRRFDYTSGVIASKSKYSYGYYEIKCKLPKGRGLWPAFWLWAGVDCNYGHEVDILEVNGARMEYAISYGANNHWTEGADCHGASDQKQITNIPRTDLNYYTYSCEWIPNKLTWYYNSNSTPVKVFKGQHVPRKSRYIIANLAVDPFYPPGSSDVEVKDKLTSKLVNKKIIEFPSIFPKSMYIQYIRYYRLKMDCSTHVNQSGFNFNTHNYAVKKSYTIYNSTVPSSSKNTLRATDYILLKSNFTVPLGSELAIVPTPCIN